MITACMHNLEYFKACQFVHSRIETLTIYFSLQTIIWKFTNSEFRLYSTMGHSLTMPVYINNVIMIRNHIKHCMLSAQSTEFAIALKWSPPSPAISCLNAFLDLHLNSARWPFMWSLAIFEWQIILLYLHPAHSPYHYNEAHSLYVDGFLTANIYLPLLSVTLDINA